MEDLQELRREIQELHDYIDSDEFYSKINERLGGMLQ